jgi:hypothetical protein
MGTKPMQNENTVKMAKRKLTRDKRLVGAEEGIKDRCIRYEKDRPKAVFSFQSGRWDLNPGPLAPHASALAGLRHAPIYLNGRPYRSRFCELRGGIIAAFVFFGNTVTSTIQSFHKIAFFLENRLILATK